MVVVFDTRNPKRIIKKIQKRCGEDLRKPPEGVRKEPEELLAAKPENERSRSVFWHPLGAVLGRFLGPSWRLGRRLGATLVVLDPQKIDAKIDQFLSASWDRIFGGFWWILGGKMEPSWDPKTIKNRSRRYSGKTN